MATAGDNLSNIYCFDCFLCFYMLLWPFFFCLLLKEMALRRKDDKEDENLSNLSKKRALIKRMRNATACYFALNEITLATQSRVWV